MSRDLLYPRRVRWSEQELRRLQEPRLRRRRRAAQHRHPRRREATVGRLCIVAAGLACLSLIVKFFAAHSGLFYRLILDRRESREERNGSEGREREETPGKWREEGEGEGWCVGVNGDGWLCGGGG